MIRLALATALALLPALLQAQEVPEPDDYRMDDYRAPVPATLSGATVIGAEEAHALWTAGGAAFIDVLPQAPKPPNLPAGTIWRDKPRDSIPGAVWLPNVGYGAIAADTADYFRYGLRIATKGDLRMPIVIFCLDDCWMSWNAAKRAIAWGHTDVRWFPEGTDDWTFFNYPTERIRPLAWPPSTE